MLFVTSRARWVACLFAAGAIALPARAHAAPDFTVSGMISLSSTAAAPLIYRTLTIANGGVLTVAAYDGKKDGTGELYVEADTIDVQSGGSIVADGAGYLGVDMMAGGCSPLSAMCALAGQKTGDPGGGGGFYGAGATGSIEQTAGTCVPVPGASEGGAAFFNKTTFALDFGSAGGASNLTGGGTAGYPGGGRISLKAAVIMVDGLVSANGGGAATHFGGVGPGGGSGGAIEITAAKLTGAGTLSVKGGQGAHGAGIPPNTPPNNGGGGSGGVVLLHLPPGYTSQVAVDVTGGATGKDCTDGAGADGAAVNDPMKESCLDLDGDGYTSSQCGGKDCDDTNPKIHPGQAEVCNGIDDNCSGQIDEGASLCPAGEACVEHDAGSASCVPVGADAGPNPGQLPQYIDFGGGCEVPNRADASNDGAIPKGAAAVAAAMALVIARSRRRRRGDRRG